MTAFASALSAYGFDDIGNLENAVAFTIPGVYGFVATARIKSYVYRFQGGDPATSLWKRGLASDENAVAPEEIFYIGSSDNLRSRLISHKWHWKRGCPEYLSSKQLQELLKARVSWILRRSNEQGVRVKIFVRYISPDLVGEFCGLPIDPLLGWERGLIRELSPQGNKAGKPKIAA